MDIHEALFLLDRKFYDLADGYSFEVATYFVQCTNWRVGDEVMVRIN